MKLALLLGLVNPNLGGILLIGPRGTAKTTAVRSLLDLLPQVERSTCHYGCLPEDVETGGIAAICPDCARKYGEGEPLTTSDRARLVELPLNARLEDVVGGINERAAVEHERMRIRRGILAQADRNLLYIDEINMLADEIVDASWMPPHRGSYTVRRGPVSATYRARFVDRLDEPGGGPPAPADPGPFRAARDRAGLEKQTERLEAYRRVQAYLANPRQMIAQFADEMEAASGSEIQAARERVREGTIPTSRQSCHRACAKDGHRLAARRDHLVRSRPRLRRRRWARGSAKKPSKKK
jgi:magnesium chelatase subunit I